MFAQRTGLQSVKQDWETFRFYKLYNNHSIYFFPIVFPSSLFLPLTQSITSRVVVGNKRVRAGRGNLELVYTIYRDR